MHRRLVSRRFAHAIAHDSNQHRQRGRCAPIQFLALIGLSDVSVSGDGSGTSRNGANATQAIKAPQSAAIRPIAKWLPAASEGASAWATSQVFRAMMSPAAPQARHCSQRGLANPPMMHGALVHRIKGTIANGSCRLNTTWLRT